MYINLQGRLGIYLDNDAKTLESDPVAILKPFSAVGDKALKYESFVRSAAVKCLDPGITRCLRLTKEHYKNLFMRYAIQIKIRSFEFLVKCVDELFQKWNKAKIMDLNESMEEIIYNEGDYIYHYG